MFGASIEVQSDISRLTHIDAFMENVMREYCIDEDFWGVLSYPLYECVKNAMIHGNKSDFNKKVFVGCTYHQSKLHFLIKDEGEGFDYQSILSGQTFTGGLAAVKLLTKNVQFSHNGSQIRYALTVPFGVKKRHERQFRLRRTRFSKIQHIQKT
ncbi:MAG: ATP-binding protein [Bacteroidales bacterium]|jgi:serine/threonine-protein kinase RsbW|nr:ATP-binding protein [Bacteroidales bacterium]